MRVLAEFRSLPLMAIGHVGAWTDDFGVHPDAEYCCSGLLRDAISR